MGRFSLIGRFGRRQRRGIAFEPAPRRSRRVAQSRALLSAGGVAAVSFILMLLCAYYVAFVVISTRWL